MRRCHGDTCGPAGVYTVTAIDGNRIEYRSDNGRSYVARLDGLARHDITLTVADPEGDET